MFEVEFQNWSGRGFFGASARPQGCGSQGWLRDGAVGAAGPAEGRSSERIDLCLWELLLAAAIVQGQMPGPAFGSQQPH